MKFFIGVIIVVGLSLGGYNLWQYWGHFKDKSEDAPPPAVAQISSGQELAGMPPSLQPALDTAKQRGAAGLKDFLTMYGNTINDPRRAWIELDYAVLLAQSSPGAARKEFARVKSRVPANSPVYPRIKQLEKTYE